MRCEFLATWALLALAATAVAQDEQADGEAPAESIEQDAAADAEATERDELEPGVPSSVLAADVRRRGDGGRVMDELDLDASEVTGNQELPKVLYIVPWQKSDPGPLMGKPVNTLLDEVLEPVDRGEFARQVRYYEDLEKD